MPQYPPQNSDTKRTSTDWSFLRDPRIAWLLRCRTLQWFVLSTAITFGMMRAVFDLHGANSLTWTLLIAASAPFLYGVAHMLGFSQTYRGWLEEQCDDSAFCKYVLTEIARMIHSKNGDINRKRYVESRLARLGLLWRPWKSLLRERYKLQYDTAVSKGKKHGHLHKRSRGDFERLTYNYQNAPRIAFSPVTPSARFGWSYIKGVGFRTLTGAASMGLFFAGVFFLPQMVPLSDYWVDQCRIVYSMVGIVFIATTYLSLCVLLPTLVAYLIFHQAIDWTHSYARRWWADPWQISEG